MDPIKRWKLADELNVYQIVLLIAWYDPSGLESEHYGRWPNEVKMSVSLYLNTIKMPLGVKALNLRNLPTSTTIIMK